MGTQAKVQYDHGAARQAVPGTPGTQHYTWAWPRSLNDLHEAGKLANRMLDAQLEISEAMLAVAKALDMSPESD